MRISFVEALDFTQVVDEYFGKDVEFAAFQNAVIEINDRTASPV